MGISSPLDSHLFKGKDCGSHYFCHPNITKDKNGILKKLQEAGVDAAIVGNAG